MAAGGDGNLELRADPIRRRDENGIVKTCGRHIEEAAKPAQAAERSLAGGSACKRFDRFDEGRTGLDIDACPFVRAAVNGRSARDRYSM